MEKEESSYERWPSQLVGALTELFQGTGECTTTATG